MPKKSMRASQQILDPDAREFFLDLQTAQIGNCTMQEPNLPKPRKRGA
jgi:hypothetical protein